MFKRLVAVSLVAMVSIANSQSALTTKPQKPIKTGADIMALAERWGNALKAGWQGGAINTAPVLSQYAPDGTVARKGQGFATGSVLLATLDGNPLETDAERQGYFSKFLQSKPEPTFLPHIQTRLLSKDVAVLSGPWDFALNNGTAINHVQARVTIVWKRYPKIIVNGQRYKYQWLIAEMQSSLLPTTK